MSTNGTTTNVADQKEAARMEARKARLDAARKAASEANRLATERADAAIKAAQNTSGMAGSRINARKLPDLQSMSKLTDTLRNAAAESDTPVVVSFAITRPDGSGRRFRFALDTGTLESE